MAKTAKITRAEQKAKQRAATMRQHEKTAAIGINPKYLNSGQANMSEQEWLKLSRKWDEAHSVKDAA